MCGIVGMVSKHQGGFYKYDLELFEQMLLCDAIRGFDSTGVITVLKNRQARVLKHNTHPLNMMASPEWEAMQKLAISEGRILIGHNRKATSGDITNENAHPFINGPVVLVHNGSITNWKDIYPEAKVDSQALSYGFAKDGVIPTLRRVQGAYAISWYNVEERKMYLVRNTERPMAMLETNNQFLFGSELGMLYWLVGRQANNGMIKDSAKHLAAKSLVTISLNPFSIDIKDLTDELKPPSQVSLPPRTTDTWIPQLAAPRATSTVGTVMDEGLGRNAANVSLMTADLYKTGSKVVILPVSCIPDDKNKVFICRGEAYNRKNPTPVPCEWRVSMNLITLEDIMDFMSAPKLLGEINFVRSDRNGIHLIVTQVKADLIVEMFDGTVLLNEEWQELCEIEVCTKCKGKLDPGAPNATSVNIKKDRIICNHCVVANAMDMPDEIKERLSR